MQRYPVSRVAMKSLNLPALKGVVESSFGPCREESGFLHASFGALKDLRVGVDGKSLAVETLMDPKVAPELQAETIRRYNQFLENATGYSSKERAKRLQAAAKKSPPG